MAKERSILELLKILLQERRRDSWGGICYSICSLYHTKQPLVTREEYRKLQKYFDSQNPQDKHKKFTKNPAWSAGTYWWTLTPEGNEQRVLFLEHLVKINKSWLQRISDKIWWV